MNAIFKYNGNVLDQRFEGGYTGNKFPVLDVDLNEK